MDTGTGIVSGGFLAILALLLIRCESIYKIWTDWSDRARKDRLAEEERKEKERAARDEVVVKELKEHIIRLKTDGDNSRSAITFLNHEQLQCRTEEERLWGIITLLHAHVKSQAAEIIGLGGKAEPVDPLPARAQRPDPRATEFMQRTQALNEKLASAAASTGVPLPAVPAVPNSPGMQPPPPAAPPS